MPIEYFYEEVDKADALFLRIECIRNSDFFIREELLDFAVVEEALFDDGFDIAHGIDFVNHFDHRFGIVLFDLDDLVASEAYVLVVFAQGDREDLVVVVSHLDHLGLGDGNGQVLFGVLEHVLDFFLDLRDNDRVIPS